MMLMTMAPCLRSLVLWVNQQLGYSERLWRAQSLQVEGVDAQAPSVRDSAARGPADSQVALPPHSVPLLAIVPHAGRLQPSLSSSHAQIQSSLVQTNFLISSHTPRSTHRLLFLFVTIHTLHRRDNATSLVHLPIKSNTPPTCSLVHNFSHQSVHLHFYPAIPSPQTAQTLFLSTFTCAYTYGANMSVSVEQPLHFSQQLSSPPHSPNHVLHAHTPASPQPPPPPPAAEL